MGNESEDHLGSWINSLFDSEFFSSGEFMFPGSSDEVNNSQYPIY